MECSAAYAASRGGKKPSIIYKSYTTLVNY